MTSSSSACPECGAPLDPNRPARCRQCRLPLIGPDAAELWQLTIALQAVEAQRRTLLERQEWLLSGLRARRDQPDAGPAPALAPGPIRPAPGGWVAPEVSGPSAQTVLLVLGGLLVTVAALVFTVVNWGRLGIGGRAAVLTALTACALVLPALLRRRGLTATAETSAAVGLALVLLDALAARAAGLAGLDAVDGVGLLLLALGATYEQRLRDARRLRDSLRRLH